MTGLIGGIVVALGLCFASPAMAAFPGGNGLLAVQPVSGGGIVLVGANGQNVRRICTDEKQCGTPRLPRWSPDGRAIVFGGPTAGIVYPDGACMDCQFGVAQDPAFEPTGTLISFVQHGRVTVDGIDAVPVHPPGVSAVTDAVWSAAGKLAVVRRGAVWAGRPGKLHRLTSGSEPSWSPSADRIALVQHGWVTIVRLSNHHVQRLARGTAPAFSPDGRWIAFVGRDHRLMVIRASGGKPRPVGHVQAASVDWQPTPRGTNPGCVAPPDSSVMASTPTAIVTQHRGTLPQFGFTAAYMGCLRADGRERLLERFDNAGESESLFTSAVLAAPYAAFVEVTAGKYFSSGDVLRVFDLRTGAQRNDLGGETAPCDFPCAVLNDVVLGSDGVSAAHWGRTMGFPYTNKLGPVACAPASTLCVLVNGTYGEFVASTNPMAGPQSWTHGWGTAWASPTFVTCPSQSLCVGAGGGLSGPGIYTSGDPGGQSGWTETDLRGFPGEVVGLSCPTASLCVATFSDRGSVATSTDPGGGAQAWNGTQIDTRDVGPVVCSAEPRCFVTDSAGTVVTSANPTGGSSDWSVSPTTPPFLSGACPTTSFCVTVNGHETATTTDPSAAAWTEHSVGDSLEEVSCPSASLCLAVTGEGQLDVSTDPASGVWTRATADITSSLVSVSCTSISLCVSTGSAGEVLVSTNPADHPSAWTRELLYPACTGTNPCTNESIEVSDRNGVHTIDADSLSAPGPLLTGLALNGDTLSWSHEGNPRTFAMTPPGM